MTRLDGIPGIVAALLFVGIAWLVVVGLPALVESGALNRFLGG